MKRIKSKLLYVILSVSVLLLLVLLVLKLNTNHSSEVSISKEAANRPEQIKIMVDTTHYSYIKAISAQFEKQYGIKVNIISMDFNLLYHRIEKSLNQSNTDLDLILVDTVWTPEFARAGYLEPLRNYIQSNLRDKIIPIAYDQRIISNDLYALPELYAFPLSIEEKFLYYNEKLLKSAGIYAPPSTWEELSEMTQYMRDKGLINHGLIWGWTPGEGLVCDYTLLSNALGVQSKDVNGHWIFDEGRGITALSFMAHSLESGLSDPLSLRLSDREAVKKFAEGKTPFMIGWAYADKMLNQQADYKMSLVPGFKGYQKSSTVTGGGALSITRTSRHKDWAWKFIDLMNSSRDQISPKDYIGSIPVWNDQISDFENSDKYLNRNLMTEQFEYAINRPNMSSYVEWSSIMQSSIDSALNGKLTAKKALDQAKHKVLQQGIK
ncbi:Trehalose-binding lipoprotein LpqY precursor [compost metagenome]